MEDRRTVRESPFACNMAAFTPEERKEHIAAIGQVFGAVEEVQELSDGYAFRLPNESTMLMKLADFIAKERLCCPFFGFSLDLEPEGGALWLSLTGREGVKPFIQAEIGNALSKQSNAPRRENRRHGDGSFGHVPANRQPFKPKRVHHAAFGLAGYASQRLTG